MLQDREPKWLTRPAIFMAKCADLLLSWSNNFCYYHLYTEMLRECYIHSKEFTPQAKQPQPQCRHSHHLWQEEVKNGSGKAGRSAMYILTEGNFPLRGRSISILFIHFRILFALHRIRFDNLSSGPIIFSTGRILKTAYPEAGLQNTSHNVFLKNVTHWQQYLTSTLIISRWHWYFCRLGGGKLWRQPQNLDPVTLAAQGEEEEVVVWEWDAISPTGNRHQIIHSSGGWLACNALIGGCYHKFNKGSPAVERERQKLFNEPQLIRDNTIMH